MNKHGDLFQWNSIDKHSSAVLTETEPTGKVIDISTEPDYDEEILGLITMSSLMSSPL